MNFSKKLSTAYFLAAFICAISLVTEFPIFYYLMKPLLGPILILYIFARFKNLEHPLIPILLVATIFSFVGDILFLIPMEPDIFKLLGICTFIIAQGSYGLLYYLSSKGLQSINKNIFSRWPELVSILILALTTIYIYPFLGDFTTPSLLYILATTITVVLALNRRFYVSSKTFGLVIGGVACFYISDVLTGMDILITDLQLRAIAITFFALGHWLIIQGMSKQFEEENESKVESSI